MNFLKRICFVAGSIFAGVLVPHQVLASNFTVIHSFKDAADLNTHLVDGEFPEGGVIFDTNGTMYGTTFGALAGGEPGKKCPKSCGNMYGFDASGALTVSYFFNASKDGAFPTGQLSLLGTTLYGTTEHGPGTGCGGLGCGTAFSLKNDGSQEKIFKFCTLANCADGGFPHGSLTPNSNGTDVFGISTVGGTGNGFLCGSSIGGCGTIYEITNDTTKSTVYSFCIQANCADGAVPYGDLFLDSAGNIYGTTQFGGAHSAGVIFKLTPGGKYTVLYSFCAHVAQGVCTDGAVPLAGVIADEAGNIYGTTTYGGKTACGSTLGCGVVFKLASSGTYSLLYEFTGGSDGAYPQSQVMQDSTGNLYGTTLRGGGGACSDTPNGCGTVYEISAGGTESILHPFVAKTDGIKPEGALALQNDRFLYGATRERGNKKCTCGTLYKIDLQVASPKGGWQSPAVRPGWVDADRLRILRKKSAPWKP